MSLGYSGLGTNSFLDTMSKKILQVETKTSWSGTRQILGLGPKQSLQEHSWLVNQVNLDLSKKLFGPSPEYPSDIYHDDDV